MAALALPFGGCTTSSVEINDLAFVMGIGVDKGSGESQYEVTAQIAKISALKPASEESKDGDGKHANGYLNIRREGVGIQSPMQDISQLINRKIYTGHNQVIVIGSDAARAGVAPILDYFIRSSGGRLTISLFVARGSAYDVLDHPSEIESLPSTYLESLIETRSASGDIIPTTIMSFLSMMLNHTGAPMAPIVELVDDGKGGDPQTLLTGMAVFKDDRMCEELTPLQTQGVLAIHGELNTGFFMLDAFDGYVTMRLSKSGSKIRPEYKDGKFKITVDINQEYFIVDTTANADLLDIEVRAQLGDMLKADALETFNGTLDKMKKNSLDVFGFGEAIRRLYPHASKDIIENWETEFPKLEVEFNVEMVVLSTGAIMRPLVPRAEYEER